ncbi:MAG: nitroreductase family protein [Erysipelotrichaceae bacterium]|nr:nitroreductase family protein [Erysipelotrichaceae bacterium]
MEAIENILSRRSIRRYTDVRICDEDLHKILEAGMSGPSCVNARDWSFIVVRERETLEKMADANGRPALPLKDAALGILVLGDLDRAFKGAPDYWIIDGAIAAQNMILAANALGIASVWLGTYPQMNRVDRLRELFSLPDHAVPHSIIAFGYADEDVPVKGFYEEDRVHFEKW